LPRQLRLQSRLALLKPVSLCVAALLPRRKLLSEIRTNVAGSSFDAFG
jgi:hypothetical protein